MMTKYLTRGGDKDVRCAFEILTPIEEIGQDGAPIYREPDDTMEEIGRFVGGDEYVIGVYGDDWVIVLTWDGNVGDGIRGARTYGKETDKSGEVRHCFAP